MMALVQEPAGAVHDPAMHDIGKAFHQQDGGKEKGNTGSDRHERPYNGAFRVSSPLFV
jgi:hypothetical protein